VRLLSGDDSVLVVERSAPGAFRSESLDTIPRLAIIRVEHQLGVAGNPSKFPIGLAFGFLIGIAVCLTTVHTTNFHF